VQGCTRHCICGCKEGAGWSGGYGRAVQASVSWPARPNGKRLLSGKAASGTLEGAEPKVLLFVCASLLLCKIDNPQNCIEHFMISFFIPKFFILVTASPFYAARRDKNGVRNVVRLSVISCRCEGRQSVASEAKRCCWLPCPEALRLPVALQLKTKALLYSRVLFFHLLTVL